VKIIAGGTFFETQCSWTTVCKTLRPMQSDRCLSCPAVCNVGVLWPNGCKALAREVGLGSGHIVLDGDSASPFFAEDLNFGGMNMRFQA